MVDRLIEVRKSLGLNQKKFCEQLGINQATYSTYETGKIKPRESVIKAICSIYSVDETWLRTGEGDMFNDKAEEEAFIKIARRLSPQNQKYLLSLAKTMLADQSFNDANKPNT